MYLYKKNDIGDFMTEVLTWTMLPWQRFCMKLCPIALVRSNGILPALAVSAT